MSSKRSPKSHPNIGEKIDEIVNDRLDHSLDDILGSIVDKRLEGSISAQIDKDVSLRIDDKIAERVKHTHIRWLELFFEDTFMFGSRWILAPAYALLVVVLVVLAVTCFFETKQLIIQWKEYDETGALTQSLVIVDIVLVMNLILMLAFVGYINFVSKIHASRTEDWPDWTTKLDYSGLKLQLLGSMIAISAIILLKELIEAAQRNDVSVQQAAITIAVHLTFVASALVVAFVNKLEADTQDRHKQGR